MRILLAPGLWVQSLTTRQPDDSQIEVALRAMTSVLEAEQLPEQAAPAPPGG
jgi:uncharacterized protein YqhQ